MLCICWNAPELCEVPKFIGVIALSKQGCCHLAEQSSTGAVSVTKVSGFVAVHLCWNAPELCEVPKFIGVIALTSKAVFILLHRAALVQ